MGFGKTGRTSLGAVGGILLLVPKLDPKPPSSESFDELEYPGGSSKTPSRSSSSDERPGGSSSAGIRTFVGLDFSGFSRFGSGGVILNNPISSN